MTEVYRYPLKAFTDTTDYLQIDIVNYVPIRENSARTLTNIDGTEKVRKSFAGRAGTRNVGVNSDKKKLEGTILLPIPNSIIDQNEVNYGESSLNSIAGAALGGVNEIMDVGKSESFADAQTRLGQALTSLFGGTTEAAGGLAGLQGFITRRLAASAVNILGANISAGQILARGNGEILNPNTEVLFNGVKLRQFGFTYKLYPRSQREGLEIKKIIRTLKYHSAAKLGSVGQEITTDFGRESFIRTPDVFELTYRKGGNRHPYLHRFKQCFLNNVSIKYTGESGYATYEDGTPTAMIMTLNFKEIEPIYDTDQEEYFKGDIEKEGVGF
jgi:hypothetical protein